MKKPVIYENTSLLKFYRSKKKAGLSRSHILVLAALHFLPRLQKPPQISDDLEKEVLDKCRWLEAKL